MDSKFIRTLLVEDDPDDVLLLKKSLGDNGTFEKVKLVHVNRLSHGMKQLAEEDVDIVLLDLNLPDSRGLATLTRLLRQTPNMPVVVLSGLGDEDTAIEAVKLGAQDYLTIGEANGAMIARVLRYAIERKRADREIWQRTEDLTLINTLNEVVNRGESFEVVLNVLAKETKRIFSAHEATVYLLSPDERHLILPHLALHPSLVEKIEQLIGRPIPGIQIPLKDGSYYQRIIQNQVGAITSDRRTIQQIMLEYCETIKLPAVAREMVRKAIPQIYKILDIKSIITIPLVSYEKTIGLMDISSPHLFIEEDLKRIQSIGGQITAALLRKRAEEALQMSAARYRNTLDSMLEGCQIIGFDWRYLYVNDAVARHGRRTKEELLGRTMMEIYPGIDNTDLFTALQLCMDDRTPKHMENEFTYPDGTTGWFELGIQPVPEGVFILSIDITERKQAEQVLQRRDATLTAVGFAAERLLRSMEWEKDIQAVLKELGIAADVSRVYLFENKATMDNEVLTSQRYEWVGAGIIPQIDNPDLQNLPLHASGFSRWVETMERGDAIHGPIREFPDAERQILQAQDIQSLLVVPIFVEARWWGFIGFDDCQTERVWLSPEIEALKTAADTLGAAIQREKANKAMYQRNRELATLYEATIAISSDLALDAVLNTVAQKVSHVLNSDGCTLSLWDRERDAVVTLADYRSKYLDATDTQGRIYYLNDYPATRHVLENGQPVAIDPKDQNADPSELAYMSEREMTGLLMLPLVSRDQVIGLMELYDEGKDERLYTQDEIIMVQSLASQAAVSIENARLYGDAQRRLKHVQALRAIDIAISGSLDLKTTLEILLDQTTSQLGVDAADILQFNAHTEKFEFVAGRGFRTHALQHTHLRLGEGYAGIAALERKLVQISDLRNRKTDFLRSPLFRNEEFVSYYAVPLIAKEQVKGVMEVFQRSPLTQDEEWRGFLQAIAGQAAIALDNLSLYNDLQRSNADLMQAYNTTIEGWSKALDMRDKETEGHTQRVTLMTLRLARAMGVDEEELVHIRRGALLHDIGKMGVPDQILLKPGPLAEDEWILMRKHPVYAYEMLAAIDYLRPALDIPYYHHEKWDGTGYPQGLKGEQIPLAARIFAVVDVWDALISDRPYRKAWTREKAISHIREQAGSHFDPEVVRFILMEITNDP